MPHLGEFMKSPEFDTVFKTETRIEAAVDVVRRFAPKFRVIDKSDSWVHRVIGFLFGLVGLKDYMATFWTTIGYTTARPDVHHSDSWATVLHEGWHAIQARRLTRLGMATLYLMPQVSGVVLGGLSIVLAALYGWPWLALLAVGGLVSFPWPFMLPKPIRMLWRAELEAEAYRVSMAVDFWTWGDIPDPYIEYLVTVFTGPAYARMWPDAASVRLHFEAWRHQLRNDLYSPTTYPAAPYLEACRALAERFKAEDT